MTSLLIQILSKRRLIFIIWKRLFGSCDFFRIFSTSRQPRSINLPMKNRKTRNRFLVHLSKNMSNEKIICRDCPDSFISDVPPYVFCCTGQICSRYRFLTKILAGGLEYSNLIFIYCSTFQQFKI